MKKGLFFFFLFVGFLIILTDIYGFFLLRQRPGLPHDIEVKNLYQIGDAKIEQEEDIEFILSRKKIGDRLSYLIKSDSKIEKKEVEIIPFYSQAPFPLIYLIIGLFSLVIGFVVFIIRRDEVKARIFYFAALAFSSALIINGGFYCLQEDWMSYIPGVLFYFSYPLAFALLLRFSFTFSPEKSKLKRIYIYTPALIFAVVLEILFLYSSLNSSIETYRVYQSILYIFRYYIILITLFALFQFILNYSKASIEEHRAQIKWILYGLIVGLGPFIILYQFPLVLKINPFISEDLSSVFFILIPIAFAFSIIRFKLMNIELIINRSLVYSFLTIFTVSFYLFSVRTIYSLFSRLFSIKEAVVSGAAALAAAAVFHPARKKIQEIVNRSFFRQSYDYQKCILSFHERAHRMASQDNLVDFFLMKIKETLPLEHLGLLIYTVKAGKYHLLIKRGKEENLSSLNFRSLKISHVLAKRKAVRTEENMDFTQEDLLDEKNFEMILPLSFKTTSLAGILSLGKKHSGERYTRDDIELLRGMAGELALNLERINLQEEVIYERAEKKKLDELNRLKTEFISTVSHELRTPMSSIRGLSEILQEGKIKEKTKKDELLSLISSECARLSRFLHNILDFGQIEQKVKKYHSQNVKIQSVIEEVITLLSHKLESKGCVIRTHLPEHPIYLEVDLDAVRQALTNLIDNAIKYSPEKSEIDIYLIDREMDVEIQVKDRGIGIPLEEQEKIFKNFYRTDEAVQLSPSGVGLGLKIVKHIMDAHKGKIKVHSQPKKGSTFSLIFTKP